MSESSPPEPEDKPDLFETSGQAPGISAIEEVKLPPEEIRRQRIRLAIAAVVGIIVIWFVVMLVQRLIYETTFRSAVDAVSEEGRPDKIDEALSFADKESYPELRARLLARAGLDGDLEKLAEARELLAGQPADADPDLRIAKVYVLLADGDPAAALTEARRPGEFGVEAAEFLRARALALVANGQWDAALNDVQAALELRDDTVQTAVLSARIMAELHGPDRGLAVLNELPRSIQKSIPGELTRARLKATQGELERAGELAQELIEDDDTTQAERAWSHALYGRAAFDRGDLKGARAALAQAAGPELRGDEALVLQIGQLALLVDDNAQAEQVLQRLNAGPSSDLPQRANTIAWWLAQSGQAQRGANTLKSAGIGRSSDLSPFGAFVLARVKEGSRGAETRQQARALYAQATSSTTWDLPAFVWRAAFEIDQGDTEAALRVAKKGLETHPNHPLLIERAVEAYLSVDKKDDALALAKEGVRAHAEEPSTHAMLGATELELGNFDAAIASFAKAAELDPTHAEWPAMRGEAARRAGKTDEARQAYEKALGLAENATALVGMLTLDLDADDLESAGKVLARIDDANASTERLDAERTRYLVRTGAGMAGVSAVRGALSRAKRDAGLHLAIGRLYLQGEQYSRAALSFRQARRVGADAKRAHVMTALAQAYGRKFKSALKSLESADEAGGSDAQLTAWARVVRAREELANDRKYAAGSQAGRAAKLAPKDADVRLIQAEVAEARGENAASHLRAAANAMVPMPPAAGYLAIKLGPNVEGCEMARRYLRAAPRGKIQREVREVQKQCK